MKQITPEQILDLLGIDYQLKSGRLAFCCPIHDDRDPSAGFYLDTQLAHCFSCEYTLPPTSFYAKVKKELNGQPWRDSKRELERIFGEFEEKTSRHNRHLLNTLRARAEKKLAEARSLPRQDHAALGETMDRILLAYERDQLGEEGLDKNMKIWYNWVREAKNAGSYQRRIPEAGLDGRLEEGPGNILGAGREADRRAVADDGAEDTVDLA